MPEEVQLYSFSQYCNRMRISDFFPLLYSIIDLIFPWLPRYILQGPCTKVVLSLILCTSLSCLKENVNERNQSLCHLVGVKTCRLTGIISKLCLQFVWHVLSNLNAHQLGRLHYRFLFKSSSSNFNKQQNVRKSSSQLQKTLFAVMQSFIGWA